jgi:hypothetical protein
MKKVEFFSKTCVPGFMKIGNIDFASLTEEINKFLERDGKDIKVIDVQYRLTAPGSLAIASVMVFYEEL